MDGCWKLIYSTISILGKKRTKLGLRYFISLGDFLQIIDVKQVSKGHTCCKVPPAESLHCIALVLTSIHM